MSDKEKLEYTGRLDQQHLGEYLAALADAVRQGAVKVAVGDRAIYLQPEGIIRVELSASKDSAKGRSSLEIELSWQQALDETAAPGLEIAAGAAEEPDEAPAAAEPAAEPVDSRSGDSRRRSKEAAAVATAAPALSVSSEAPAE